MFFICVCVDKETTVCVLFALLIYHATGPPDCLHWDVNLTEAPTESATKAQFVLMWLQTALLVIQQSSFIGPESASLLLAHSSHYFLAYQQLWTWDKYIQFIINYALFSAVDNIWVIVLRYYILLWKCNTCALTCKLPLYSFHFYFVLQSNHYRSQKSFVLALKQWLYATVSLASYHFLGNQSRSSM